MEKKILDVTCGSRTIWFNKTHPAAVYCDSRRESYTGIWKSTKNDSERQSSIGKTIFLSHKEAEKALQEMEGKA